MENWGSKRHNRITPLKTNIHVHKTSEIGPVPKPEGIVFQASYFSEDIRYLEVQDT